MITIYNRKQNIYDTIQEKDENKLKFLYNTIPGRFLLKIFLINPWFNNLMGLYYKSIFSRPKMKRFIKENHINLKGIKKKKYYSFNSFFIREREKITSDTKVNELPAVCDGKLLAIPIKNDFHVNIKGAEYTLSDITGTGDKFDNGTCLIFRLSMDDYHRYIFPDNGKERGSWRLGSSLHTIRPISARYKTFHRNERRVSLLETDNFGDMYYIEIGAMLVGKIKDHKLSSPYRFNKLQEKGYFEFGGSTIVLIVNKDIKIDEDIIENSKRGIESIVMMGDKIGEKHD